MEIFLIAVVSDIQSMLSRMKGWNKSQQETFIHFCCTFHHQWTEGSNIGRMYHLGLIKIIFSPTCCSIFVASLYLYLYMLYTKLFYSLIRKKLLRTFNTEYNYVDISCHVALITFKTFKQTLVITTLDQRWEIIVNWRRKRRSVRSRTRGQIS